MAASDTLTRLRYRYLPEHLLGELLTKRWIDNVVPFFALIVAIIVFGTLIPDFFSASSLADFGRQVAEFGLIVLGLSIVMLSGDVHHSYVSEARPADRHRQVRSTLLQAVCSPIRNPLSRNMRFATAVLSYGVAGPIGRLASKSAHVPDAPLTWRYAEGPWFDNNLACLEVRDRSLKMWWVTGEVVDAHDRPRLAKVASYALEDDGRPPAHETVRQRFARGVRRRVRDKVRDGVRQR